MGEGDKQESSDEVMAVHLIKTHCVPTSVDGCHRPKACLYNNVSTLIPAHGRQRQEDF